MLKASGWILTAGLILGGTRARGQVFPPPGMGGQMPPEMAEMQKAQERVMKETAPELYAFQAKLRRVEEKMAKIMASVAKQETNRASAKDELISLIKEEKEIRDDPDYLAEQKLAQAVFSSPEFQEKMKALMAKFGAARKGGRP